MNRLASFVLVSVMVACGGTGKPVGSLGGACTQGGACDEGLECNISHECEESMTTTHGNDAATQHGNDGGTSTGGTKRVFITSTAYSGNLMGISGGDALCGAAATAAGLGGSWVAWLSGGSVNAVDHVRDVSPWYLVDGTTLVFGTAAQLRTTPNVIIQMNEKGKSTVDDTTQVWTGTQTGGTASGDDCDSWTNTGAGGTAGDANAESDWTDGSDDNVCFHTFNLYCFEQ